MAPEPVLIPEITQLADPASSTITYIGRSVPGTATSAAGWQVSKLTFDADGDLLSQKWADGNGNFDNVWDDRASLTYT